MHIVVADGVPEWLDELSADRHPGALGDLLFLQIPVHGQFPPRLAFGDGGGSWPIEPRPVGQDIDVGADPVMEVTGCLLQDLLDLVGARDSHAVLAGTADGTGQSDNVLDEAVGVP